MAHCTVESSEPPPHCHDAPLGHERGRLARIIDIGFFDLYIWDLCIEGITLYCSNECRIQAEQPEAVEYQENGKCRAFDSRNIQTVQTITLFFSAEQVNCDVVCHIDEAVFKQESCKFSACARIHWNVSNILFYHIFSYFKSLRTFCQRAEHRNSTTRRNSASTTWRSVSLLFKLYLI